MFVQAFREVSDALSLAATGTVPGDPDKTEADEANDQEVLTVLNTQFECLKAIWDDQCFAQFAGPGGLLLQR